MSWPAVLYFLSFLSLCLGIYMIYTGRKSHRRNWIQPLTALIVAIWITGVAVATESRSPLTVAAALFVTEIA
ncbi:MAG: hypothetical protein LBQ14_01695, partial [Treponema sp.]|nr:hypothetical protein [Treponema sp.]